VNGLLSRHVSIHQFSQLQNQLIDSSILVSAPNGPGRVQRPIFQGAGNSGFRGVHAFHASGVESFISEPYDALCINEERSEFVTRHSSDQIGMVRWIQWLGLRLTTATLLMRSMIGCEFQYRGELPSGSFNATPWTG
jgi:hypothetical protein